MEILPVNNEWIHTFLLTPYLQGCEKVNRAWRGFDDQPIVPVPLSMKERIVSWLVGVILMIPLINTIIWIFWQTFGNPDDCVDLYCPESDYVKIQRPERAPVAAAEEIAPIEEREVGLPQQFDYNETIRNFKYSTHWTISEYPNRIIVQRTIQDVPTTAYYTHNWALKQFCHDTGNKLFEFALSADGKNLRICINKKFVKNVEFVEQIPWIQQPQVGLIPFIRSEETEISFYVVITENPFRIPFSAEPPMLMKCTAKKLRETEDSGLVKVQGQTTWGLPYSLVTGEGWFDANTGLLQKFVATDPTGVVIRKTGDLLTR